MTWHDRFRTWLANFPRRALGLSIALGISPSSVHQWTRGTYPRDPMRERIERLSKGEVGAHLPSETETESKPRAAQG